MANYCVPDKGRAALLTISAQEDFVRPGSPYKASGIRRVRPALRRMVEGFRAQGAPVLHSVRLYLPDGSNVDACRRQAVEEGLRVFMPGTLGAELLDEIKPESSVRLDPECLLNGRFQKLGPGEWAFYRPRWGAFHETHLEARLKDLGVSTLVICGFSFATAMRATIYEASARDFRIILVSDAVGNATDEGVRELGRIGLYLMTAESCVHWLGGSSAAA